MELERNVGGRDRLARAVLAVGLAVVALGAFRSGRRGTGLVAAVGSLAFGVNATVCFCELNRLLGVDTTGE
ncbi:MAG: DUF2892 domain-containing protein [Haloferacaceae archaeon]